MKKVLSLVVLTALSVMLAVGVTLAADSDEAYGVGTVMVYENPEIMGNDVELVMRWGDSQMGEWTKLAAWLGDFMWKDVGEDTVTQDLLVRNNHEVSCIPNVPITLETPAEEIPNCEEAAPVKYKLMIGEYLDDPTENQDMVYVTIKDLSNGKVLYEGLLSQVDSAEFEVGHTYVDGSGLVVHRDISEIEIKYDYWQEVPAMTYLQYTLNVVEVL